MSHQRPMCQHSLAATRRRPRTNTIRKTLFSEKRNCVLESGVSRMFPKGLAQCPANLNPLKREKKEVKGGRRGRAGEGEGEEGKTGRREGGGGGRGEREGGER